jgi:hypothetical protein
MTRAGHRWTSWLTRGAPHHTTSRAGMPWSVSWCVLLVRGGLASFFLALSPRIPVKAVRLESAGLILSPNLGRDEGSCPIWIAVIVMSLSDTCFVTCEKENARWGDRNAFVGWRCSNRAFPTLSMGLTLAKPFGKRLACLDDLIVMKIVVTLCLIRDPRAKVATCPHGLERECLDASQCLKKTPTNAKACNMACHPSIQVVPEAPLEPFVSHQIPIPS